MYLKGNMGLIHWLPNSSLSVANEESKPQAAKRSTALKFRCGAYSTAAFLFLWLHSHCRHKRPKSDFLHRCDLHLFFNDSVNNTSHAESDLFKSHSGHFHTCTQFRYISNFFAMRPHSEQSYQISCDFYITLSPELSVLQWDKSVWRLYLKPTLDILKSFSAKLFMSRSHHSWLRLCIHRHFRIKVAATAPNKAIIKNVALL